jgi:NADH-quinone oxidoreductase subunit N
MARPHPGQAAVLVICLLSLVGTPPTAVFVGKLEVFTATIDGGYSWLAVANTVVSLFYYLRWLGPVFLRDGTDPRVEGPAGALAPSGRWSAAAPYAAGGLTLALGLAAGLALPLAVGPPLP